MGFFKLKSRTSSTITGAIFDCDGTLIDSLAAWQGIEDYLAGEAQITVTDAERERFATFTIPEIAVYFHTQYGLYASAREVINCIDDFMLSYYRTQATLLPGVAELLEACVGNGVRMSIASSSPLAYLEAGLACAGIRDYFVSVVSVDEVGVSKREPAAFDKAWRDMQTEKLSTWGFEDSLYAMDTLRKAGYGVVGIYDAGQEAPYAEVMQRADIAVSALSEITVTQGQLRMSASDNTVPCPLR